MFKRIVLIASVLLALGNAATLTEEEKKAVKKACDDGKAQIQQQIDGGSLTDDTCKTVAEQVSTDKTTQDAYAKACPQINVKANFGSATTCAAFVAAYTKTCNEIIACGGGSSGGSSGGSDPCFPSGAKVTLADGTKTRVDKLKEGDSIVSVTSEGEVFTDTVSILSLSKPAAMVPTFVTLTMNTTAISLTDEHRVPVGDACCSMLKKAKDVKVGDKVWTVAEGAKVPTKKAVTKINPTSLIGLHSPVLTHGGFPVVDGVVTAWDNIETITLAKHTLKYLLPLCKAFSSCNLFRRTFLAGDRKYIDEA